MRHIELPTLSAIESLITPILTELKNLKTYSNETNYKHQFYKNKDLKKIFDLSDNTIKHYRKINYLPFTKIGSIYYYPINEIDKILKDNSNYDLINNNY